MDEWDTLYFEISSLFSGAPIDEEDLFAGRSHEVRRILDAVFEKSRHVVLFGERGVGKTSLSNIFWKRFNQKLQSFVVARVQATPVDTFVTLWRRALEELKYVAATAGKERYIPFDLPEMDLTQSQIRHALSQCSPNSIPIIIIDEYDKLKDPQAKELTANLIKELYDTAISTTVILVGVAENIGQLIQDHQSIGRAITQIPLNRMSVGELKEIIESRAKKTKLSLSSDAIWTIITLSRGLPYFTQTLSKHAALHAIEGKRLSVSNKDVEEAMERFIEDSESSFKDNYRGATRSNQDNHFKESLLACALARTDDEGFFTANDVVEPFSAIMKEKKRIAHFEKHLRRFCAEDGGNILTQRGGERQLRYRFADPMMQPYIIIRGIQEDVINSEARSKLLQREQGVLPL